MSSGRAPMGGSPQQQQQQRRANRTLAWYIGDIAERGGGDERDSTSPAIRPFMQAHAMQHHQRKDSLDSESSHNSSVRNTGGSFSSANELEERQRRSGGGERGRALSNAQSAQQQRKGAAQKAAPQAHPNKENSAEAVGQRKDDYWYYDPRSDGFYYEKDGSRGWRKRNTKLHGTPTALMHAAAAAHKAQGGEAGAGAGAGITAAQPASKFFPNGAVNAAAAAQQANIKYYDAATDGFFYEMASVDGWRRRQPANGAGSLPNYPYAPQPMGHFQPQRVFRPLQPAPQQPKSFGSPPTAFHCMPPPTTGFFAPISGCTCQHAAAKVVQPPSRPKPQQQEAPECPSSPSTAMSSSLSDASPPPPPQPAKFSGGGTPAWQPANVGQPETQLTTLTQPQQPIGSFEEPYEFYWSDNERAVGAERAGSMASSMDDFGPAVRRERENSLSDYFRELCGMAPVGGQAGEAPAPPAQKRPDTLRLSCSMNSGATAAKSGTCANLPNFNVDQFIADLPQMVDQEQLLRNLSALRTPMVDAGAARSFDPMLYNSAADSPLLCTPIQGMGAWERAGHHHQPPQPVGKPPAAGKSAGEGAGSVGRLEMNLLDIQKIWQCPAF